jgi:hypothetical protein
MMEAAIGREGDGDGPGSAWAPRIPLGLMLLEQGRISEEQLRQASRNQQLPLEAGGDDLRLEEWLVSSGLLSEAALTRAISAQWNCPVFSLPECFPVEMASVIPPFLAEAVGALPVRVTAGKLLYLAFSKRIDRSLSYAIEHVTGLRVAAGIARESEFRRAQAQFLSLRPPGTRFFEAEDRRALAAGMAGWLEEMRPMEARLARVHDLWWLRIRGREQEGGAEEDLLATVGQRGGGDEERRLEEIALPPIRSAEGSGAHVRNNSADCR